VRVLLWSQYFWPESFLINELVTRLQEEQVHVCVLTGKPNYPEGKIFPGYRAMGIQHEHYAGAEVVRVPLIPRSSGSLVQLALNYLSFIISGCLVAPLALRGRKCDVIFVYAPSPLLQTLPALLVARLKRVPLIVWVQDLWPDSLSATGVVSNRWVLRTVEAVVRYIYRRADSILIQSEAFRDSVARLTNEPGKIRYFPNTTDLPGDSVQVDVNNLAATEIRRGFSVVFAGNIGKAQSMETIVKAAECLRSHVDIKFFIVGGGSEEAWLREEIRRRNLPNVILIGRLAIDAMPAIYDAASALLVTLGDSPALAATIPSKLQAYLAAGKPVIASMNGEGARVISDAEAGIACPAKDFEALAAAVLRLQSLAPEERSRLGANGRRYFSEQFNSAKWVRELVEHFADMSAAGRKSN
jgi:glycosyltransferase involved in cell wall biosynthesis